MRHPWVLTLVLALSLLLSACGGGSSAQAPTAAPAPTERPTLTPRSTATAEPTKKPEPTEEPEATEEPTETADEAATAEQITRDIDMEDLQTYSYKTGIFSIDVPASWQSDDRSSEGEVLVRFTDVAENGVILVDLFERAEQQTSDQLIDLLNNYLDTTYKAQPNFSRDDPSVQSDGSVLVVWGYDVDLQGKTVRLLGNSFVEQRDNLVSVLTIALPDEQFHALKEPINTILNSYKFDTSVSVSASGESSPTAGATDLLKPVDIGDLETYSYKTGLFQIDVPSNWTMKDNSKSGEAIMLWTDPSENGLLVVDIFASEQSQTPEEMTTLLKNFLDKTFGSEPEFTMNDPKEQSDGSQLIVWSYVATANGGIQAKLLGNSFIEQHDDKISILTTVVPNDQFDTLKTDTNTIINSYKLDASADLP